MPQRKKDPSTRARANKASTQATLARRALRSVEELTDLTVAELRLKVDELNEERPTDSHLSRGGTKAQLIARILEGELYVPPLPDPPPMIVDDLPVPTTWHDQTLAWWNDVWTSPMAAAWDDSDIHNVYVVALLYDDIWTATSAKQRKDALGEFRLQRADLGLSPYSRRRLEWTIEGAREAQERGDKRRQAAGQPAAPQRTTGTDPRDMLTLLK